MDMLSILGSQWVNLAGLISNFAGVALVAFEWQTSMYDSLDRLELETALQQVLRGDNPQIAIGIAPKAKKLIDEITPEELEAICADGRRFEAFTKTILLLDTAARLNRRRMIFRLGFGAILLGTSLQFMAAWPR